jgi:hypothetical protein
MNVRNLSLPQQMLLWGALREQMDVLEAAIGEQVLQLKKTQIVGNVGAVYGEGRGSYDYAAIASQMGASQVLIQGRTTQVVDWRGVCADLEAALDLEPDAIEKKKQLYTVKEQFFKPGRPQVRLEIKKQKTETG